eukprot:161770-Chlamydomonas_euryale.AAC.5
MQAAMERRGPGPRPGDHAGLRRGGLSAMAAAQGFCRHDRLLAVPPAPPGDVRPLGKSEEGACMRILMHAISGSGALHELQELHGGTAKRRSRRRGRRRAPPPQQAAPTTPDLIPARSERKGGGRRGDRPLSRGRLRNAAAC